MRALLALLLLLPLAACDEATGLDAPVDLVVEDAVAAREGGDLPAAVALLEGAFERAPENTKVRVELATTLLQRDGLDLLDLERISSFLATSGGSTAARTRVAGCTAASDPSAEVFDPTAVEGFAELAASAATLSRAASLLSPVIPAALQSFDLCTSVQNGTLSYDRDGALAALAGLGLSEQQQARALAVNALARFLDAYRVVANDLPQQATWYRLADGSVTICVEDEDALRESAEGAIRDVGLAVLSLDARATLLGTGSVAGDLVEQALGAYEDLRDAIADYCAA